MAAFLDRCRFIPTAGGTGDFTYATAVGGCQSPQAAGAANGVKYKLAAETSDLTQWEVFEGAYDASTGTFVRTKVLYNSLGTGAAPGQSGAGAKINFSTVPQIAVVGLAEDLISIEAANSFTATQQAQARANIGAALAPNGWTRTVLTSGSGTYITKASCKALLVRLIGGGGGGGGGGGASATGGSAGGTTTFGTLSAGGGSGAGGMGAGAVGGGVASGGDINVSGTSSQPSFGAGGGSQPLQGTNGAPGAFGGSGYGGWPGANGASAPANSGGGGGGGGSNNGAGAVGGGAGAYCEKLIANPSASYTYAVGAGGASGIGNSGTGTNGGAGGSGLIIIDEYY
ncbi:hypothetical protein [Bradyrhizobium sp. SZCCHNR2032]|uniref:hypothetical protein n=1 Tax=Bradyrhizobium sp. SZCCHNR2032 TaxID=3057384 RepID=UPI002915D313|nr:hypothetical protein [Bradyrhizobium sp. SZCCHNR2032]